MTVAQGAVVPIANLTAVAHGVHWVYSPATPSCSGVPVGTTPESSGTNWSGSCTFSVPGTYTFYCTVHGAAMSGTIRVNAPSTPPPSTAPSPTTYGSTETTPTSSGQSSSGPTAGVPAGSPLAGSARSALKLASGQRGGAVRGTIAISPAGAGGRLEVDLLARSASLASARRSAQARVGVTVRSSLTAGTVPFSVTLNARARAAVHRRGRLALTVKVEVKPVGAAPTTLARAVVVRR